MKILNPAASIESFFAELKQASEKVLLLDYDGTLAPFVVNRNEAYPYPGILPRLKKMIFAPGSRVVIISGRAISDLKRLLDLEPLPELWGCHGAEKFSPRFAYKLVNISSAVIDGMRQIKLWAGEMQLNDHLEEKPSGLAFHWRGLTEARVEEIRMGIESKWIKRAAEHGLQLHPFDGGLEFRIAGISKADAVLSILSEISPGAKIAYLGDDLTDEDAFKALGTKGLKVLVRDRERSTVADIWLKPPEELYEFLDRWSD